MSHFHNSQGENLRLTLEIFHDIEKFIVHFCLIYKSYLDLVEVAQGILQVC